MCVFLYVCVCIYIYIYIYIYGLKNLLPFTSCVYMYTCVDVCEILISVYLDTYVGDGSCRNFIFLLGFLNLSDT